MKRLKFLISISILLLFVPIACTDLKEEVLDEQLGTELLDDPNNIQALVNAPYASLRHIIEWYDYWAMQEVCTDETAVPTRGSDWYDNAAWQQLYLHTWDADHVRPGDVWDVLGQGVARANIAMHYIAKFDQDETTELDINEARFLRAYYYYLFVDLFGQVPYRDTDDFDYTTPPRVMDRETAINFVISEIEAVLPNLATKASVASDRVSQGAANALLAKIYLNYEVYTGTSKWDEAISYCDKVINSGLYSVTSDYWSMFQWDVAENSEFILRVPMSDDVDMGSGSVWINFTLHYKQVFGTYTSFWNGPCTTPDLLNTFDQTNDTRFYDDRIKATTGINQGFLIGAQHDVDGNAITIRDGVTPLNFVPEFNLLSSDENAGVRVIKFAPNPNTSRQFSSPNDVPLLRISDIYLCRAEAKLRNGDADGALADVNYIRARRSAEGKTLALLTSVTLDDILKERGFELYWEGFRRQDLIRFGKFTAARYQKPATDATREIYPIPTSALDVNPNLSQNPGY